jgi:hypothetical protein
VYVESGAVRRFEPNPAKNITSPIPDLKNVILIPGLANGGK